MITWSPDNQVGDLLEAASSRLGCVIGVATLLGSRSFRTGGVVGLDGWGDDQGEVFDDGVGWVVTPWLRSVGGDVDLAPMSLSLSDQRSASPSPGRRIVRSLRRCSRRRALPDPVWLLLRRQACGSLVLWKKKGNNYNKYNKTIYFIMWMTKTTNLLTVHDVVFQHVGVDTIINRSQR